MVLNVARSGVYRLIQYVCSLDSIESRNFPRLNEE